MEILLPLLTALIEFFLKLLGNKEALDSISKKKWGVLQNLPKPVPGFVGRKEDKERVHQALKSEFDVVSVEGIGGVGKSTLVLEVAHECLDVSRGHKWSWKIPRFRAIVWASAKDREFTENTLLDTIATTLGQSSLLQQPLEAKRLLVRGLLEKKACLLVVDNFETIADDNVRLFIMDLPGRSKSIITTRERFLDATPIALGNLSQAEALELIRREAKHLNLETVYKASNEKILPLYQKTGGVPLALKWAIGQIKQKGQSLDIVLEALESGSGDIFKQIFERSWDLLKENENARTILKITPLFATSATRDALKVVSSVESQFDNALGQLVEMSLVDDIDDALTGKRYGIHPLTRFYSFAALECSPQEKEAAITRLAAFYHSTVHSYKDWRSGEYSDDAPLDLEIPNIFHIIDLCLDEAHYDQVNEMFDKLWRYLFVRSYWNDIMTVADRLGAYAYSKGDEVRWARFQVWPVSSVYRHRGQFDLASDSVDRALDIYSRYENTEKYRAVALRHMGRIYQEQKRYDDSKKCLMESYEYYLRTNSWETHILVVNLAELAIARGDLDDAERWQEEGALLLSKFKDLEMRANLFLVMGQIQLGKGDLTQARKEVLSALDIMSNLKRLDGMADSYFWQAKIEKASKNRKQARIIFNKALGIYRQMGINNKVKEIETELSSL